MHGAETRNPAAHAGAVIGDGAFNIPSIPPAALHGFNYVSGPASADPVVKYTIERAMADIRAADKRTRHMLLIEAAAKQLAFQITSYEEAVQEEQAQEHAQAQAQAHSQGHPPPPEAISKPYLEQPQTAFSPPSYSCTSYIEPSSSSSLIDQTLL
jgi:hypothetical protein